MEFKLLIGCLSRLSGLAQILDDLLDITNTEFLIKALLSEFKLLIRILYCKKCSCMTGRKLLVDEHLPYRRCEL